MTFEDSKGNLWVGTMGGLATYDRNTDSFTSIPLYKGKQLVYSDITQIIENKEGTLWASSSGEGLFRILPEQARGECITAVNRLGFRHLSTLLDDGNGNLWIGAENDGLICYNTANESIKTFKAPVISEDNISSLAKDEYGYIYIGTLTGGLNVYNPFTKQIRQIPYQGRYDLQIKTLTYIDHQLYIGTDGEGLKLYDANMSEMIDKQLENSRFEIENKKYIPSCSTVMETYGWDCSSKEWLLSRCNTTLFNITDLNRYTEVPSEPSVSCLSTKTMTGTSM